MTETYSKIKPGTDSVVEIDRLYKSFGDNHVLRDFNFNLYRNENAVVLDKSGVGTSVLIKCIIGLMMPDSGTVKVFGKNIPDSSPDELDPIRTNVGFLLQSNALYDSMLVRENL